MLIWRLIWWFVTSGILIPFGIGMLVAGPANPALAIALIIAGAVPKLFIEYLRQSTA